MKDHAIIPIFIPHKGCPNDCVFCNQRKITARTADVTAEDVRATIEMWLTTLDNVRTIEVAFYGGSFTGLSIEEQSYYLKVAQGYKDAGQIHKIHLSTRPDYIDRPILENLKKYSVDTVELGVQSFDDAVLRASNRGHTAADVYSAVTLLKEYGFEFGIQLMIGLPRDSMETCIYSARETVKLKPHLTRLYPTIVIDDTELYNMYIRGEYKPLSREEAINRTKQMYRILYDAGIYIMRVGLKSTDIIGDGGAINGGTYHPAFRQLVEGRIARDEIEDLLQGCMARGEIESASQDGRSCGEIKSASQDGMSRGEIASASQDGMARGEIKSASQDGMSCDSRNPHGTIHNSSVKIDVFSNPRWYSNMVGNGAENKEYFARKYPKFNMKFKVDEGLDDMCFRVLVK